MWFGGITGVSGAIIALSLLARFRARCIDTALLASDVAYRIARIEVGLDITEINMIAKTIIKGMR